VTVSVRRGVRIGAGLGADLLLPDGAGPVPAVVALMPYRVDSLGGAGCWTTLRRFAEAGYGCVLVASHGNTLRALVKHLEAVSDESASSLEVPNAVPLCYEFEPGHVTRLACS